MWTILVLAAALAALFSFAWGLQRHFRNEGRMPPGMRALSAASSLAALVFGVQVLRHGPGGDLGLAGTLASLLLSLAALALFWWAVRTTRARPPAVAHLGDSPEMVFEDGPYAHVRHPFYLAYCLFWVGTAAAAGGVQWLLAALLVGWYYRVARAEEAGFARSGVAAAYARYKARTGMILPRLLPAAGPARDRGR